jgi:hypothetical protein
MIATNSQPRMRVTDDHDFNKYLQDWRSDRPAKAAKQGHP